MADYKAIKGHNIQTVDGDPSVLQTGDIWYNSSVRKIRGAKIAAGAWASGGNLNTARTHGGGLGTQTASLLVGGYVAPSAVENVETYDGSAWTEGSDITTTRRIYHGGSGTTTAGIVAGGYVSTAVANTETYDGSSWTEVADLGTARYAGGCGTQTAALAVSGSPPVDNGEEWNGSSWTEIADVNTIALRNPAMGTTTAALKYAGNPGYIAAAELWNGTSWTEVNDLNTGRVDPGGAGTSTLALCYGGQISTGVTNVVEEYDGTSWTEVADLATARQGLGGGTNLQSAALGMGGTIAPGGHSNATEEWTKSVAA